MSLASLFQPLKVRWTQLAAREQRLVWLAGTLVLGLLLWQLSLKPALATLRTADAQTRALNTQLQQMQSLQAQAQALQKQPPLGFDEALRLLTASTKQTLGASAQFSISGERASIALKEASPDALAEWLTQARLNARSVPLEAHLLRSAAPGSVSWNGTLTMSLPPR